MRATFLGGFAVWSDQKRIEIKAPGQRALLFLLALNAPAVASYRDLAEDLWPEDTPTNARAALQSVVSRLRLQLPDGAIVSEPGGYRFNLQRREVDILHFQDLVAAAEGAEPAEASDLATEALSLWAGEPWLPGEQFDWLRSQLLSDRELALKLGGRFALDENPGAPPPAPLTAMIGRRAELSGVIAQLELSRLVTIIGTGGSGKTRLAVEASAARSPSLIVELAPVGKSEIWQAILAAAGRHIRGRDASSDAVSPRERVLELLAGRGLTLVLDNCEHIISEVSEVVTELLSSIGDLRILTTSREPLGIIGESFVNLGPLDHPRLSEEFSNLDESSWASYPALELLDRRAVAARGRPISKEEFPDAARLVSRLDGLPLALELAAAKFRTMTVEEVADGLDDRFTLLGRGVRGAVARHQTLRALFDWSWALLSDPERRVLSWLAIRPAGVGAADAAGLIGDCSAEAGVLEALVDRSLVQRVGGRFRMLETVREYGIERLAEAGETELALKALAEEVARGVEREDPRLRTPETLDAIAWFDAEEDTVAATLRFAIDEGLGAVACRIALGMTWYWLIRDRNSDAISWVTQVSAVASGVPSEAGVLLRIAGPLLAKLTSEGGRDDREALKELLEASVRDLRAEQERSGSQAGAIAQLLLVVLSTLSGVFAEGKGPADVEIPYGEDLGLSPWPVAMLHLFRAAISQNGGDTELLGSSSEAAVSRFSEIGDVWGLALSRQMRSEWLTLEGRLEEALEVARASTEGLRRITSTWDLSHQQGLIVTLLCRLGRWDEGEQLVSRLLEEGLAGGSRAELAASLNAASFWMARKEADVAASHLSRVEILISELPNRVPQLEANAGVVAADIAIARGDLEGAAELLKRAAAKAIESGDQPVIAQVAVEVGILALERGDSREAGRALELATVIRGSSDSTDLKVRRLEAALPAAGRGNSELSSRPAAVEQLGQILEIGQILRR